MTSWLTFTTEAPELATKVRSRFDATKHHVLATLRHDGSPRVSGTEVRFFDDNIVLGSMPESVKARDLQRDGRCAIHANPGESTMEGGDAKLAGRAVEITDEATLDRFRDVGGESPPGPFHLFRVDLGEVVLTELHPDGDCLVITRWVPGEGVTAVERR